MTWDEIGRDSLEAAKLLREAGRHRSSVSRAYYAVYARITAAIASTAVFVEDREGPGHDSLPDLAFDHLSRLTYGQRREIETSVRRLYQARIYADYHPSRVVANAESRQSVLLADRVFRKLDKHYA